MLSHTAKIITKKRQTNFYIKKEECFPTFLHSFKSFYMNFILRSLLERKLHQNVDYATKVQIKTDKSKKQRGKCTTRRTATVSVSRAPVGSPPHPPSLSLVF